MTDNTETGTSSLTNMGNIKSQGGWSNAGTPSTINTSSTNTSKSLTTNLRFKHKNKNKQENTQANGSTSTIQSVIKSFEGMTSAIKVVLTLPGEKVEKAKPAEVFRNIIQRILLRISKPGLI